MAAATSGSLRVSGEGVRASGIAESDNVLGTMRVGSGRDDVDDAAEVTMLEKEDADDLLSMFDRASRPGKSGKKAKLPSATGTVKLVGLDTFGDRLSGV